MKNKEIGDIILERRKMLHLKQRDLSELSGTTLPTIIKIEKGNGNPSLNTIEKIAEVLGLAVQISLIDTPITPIPLNETKEPNIINKNQTKNKENGR